MVLHPVSCQPKHKRTSRCRRLRLHNQENQDEAARIGGVRTNFNDKHLILCPDIFYLLHSILMLHLIMTGLSSLKLAKGFCLVSQQFNYPNGIEGWSSSISVTLVILDNSIPCFALTNQAAFGKGMGVVNPDNVCMPAHVFQMNRNRVDEMMS